MKGKTSLGLLLALLLLPAISIAEEQINSIRIEGLERTDPRTVRRELPFHEGDIWKEKWRALAERWLRNTGLFSEVHVQGPDEGGTVTVRVHERWSLWLLPTASRKDNGASSAGVTLDEYNMWGLGHHLRLAAKQDTGKNFSASQGNAYEASYAWRRIADSKFSMDVAFARGDSVFDAYQNGTVVSQYLHNSNSSSVSFSYGFGPVPGEGWTASLGYGVAIDTYQLSGGVALPDVQPQRKHEIRAGISYAQVDDHITWFTGTAMDYSLAVAHSALGSSYNIYRQSASVRSYVPIDNGNTFNTRLNAGVVTGNVQRDGLFDLGGHSAIRGYYPGEIQGTAYIYGTFEWRYLLEPGSNVQLVAFSDAGYVTDRGALPYGKSLIVGAGGGVRWTLRWLVHGTIRGDVTYGFATGKWRFYVGTGQDF